MAVYKPIADLNFTERFTQPNADLEFGKVVNASHATATINLPLPSISVTATITENSNVTAVIHLPMLKISARAVSIAELVRANANITLPMLKTVITASYDSNVWRGVWAKGKNKSETAQLATLPMTNRAEKSALLHQKHGFYQERADLIHTKIATNSQLSERVTAKAQFSNEVARYVDSRWQMGFEDLIYLSNAMQHHMEVARYVAIRKRGGFETMFCLRHEMQAGMETAKLVNQRLFSKAEIARYLADGHTVGFEVARPVPYATNRKSVILKGQYSPNADLNFTCKWVAPNAELNFGVKCQPQDRRLLNYDEVVFVSNDISLTNLETGKGIAIFSGNIGIDNKAYCWSLSAEIAYFETIEKGMLVELAIGGETWRFIIDEISEGRQFGETTINISGKSQAVLLAYPFTDLRGYKYSQNISAVQIAQHEIEQVGDYGEWSLDWRLVGANGWLIPANAYSYTQFTPIQVIQDIANAGGGFVNAHPSEKRLLIKSDYPVASWDWASLKPDIVIPDSLIWSKGDTYTEKPNYNGVWVSSDKDNGVQGFIRRKGTDGSVSPEQVIHSAITEQSVAIHRGLCELSQAGITQNIALTTPLHGDIGILTPSDFVTVKVAGMARNAIVRGVNISFSMGNDGKIDVQNQLKLEAKA